MTVESRYDINTVHANVVHMKPTGCVYSIEIMCVAGRRK